jgi:hypothetical protein
MGMFTWLLHPLFLILQLYDETTHLRAPPEFSHSLADSRTRVLRAKLTTLQQFAKAGIRRLDLA